MEQQEEKEQKRKKPLIYPWILLILMALATGVYFYCHRVAAEQARPQYKIAVVNVEELMAKHKDYSELAKLQKELEGLQSDIKQVNGEIASLQKLDLKPEIFQSSLEKSSELVDFQSENKLNNEAITQRKLIEGSLVQEHKQALYKINQYYGAKIVSIQLKLDNRDKMLLTKDDINKLKEDLLALENQRRQAVQKADLVYRNKVEDNLAAWKKKRREELGLKAQDTKEIIAQQVQEREKASDEQEDELMKNLQKVMALKAQLLVLQGQKFSKEQDVKMLEESMRSDIASFASKVAIEQHYDLVMVKDISKTKYPLDGAKVTEGAADITAEVGKALEQAGIMKK